jgi:hypothetical protein
MSSRIAEGTRVIYAYIVGGQYPAPYFPVVRHSGTGVVIRNDVLIGTDDGYAVKQDSDGEVAYVRDWGVKVI